MRQAVKDDQDATDGHGGVDIALGEPHDGGLLELPQLHELPSLLHEHGPEQHDGEDAQEFGGAAQAAREPIDHEMEAEVARLPHADGGAEEDHPHEEEAGDLVVPRESAAQHIAGEHAQENVRAQNHHHDEEETLDAVGGG